VLLLLPRQKGESEQRSKTKAGVAAAAVLLLPDIVVGKRLWGQFHAMEKLAPGCLAASPHCYAYMLSVALSVSVVVAFNACALEIRLTMDSAGQAENASYG
jgi:hypothetical protein